MPEKFVQIAFRQTEEYRENLQRLALGRKQKVQHLLLEAVNEFVERIDTQKPKEKRPLPLPVTYPYGVAHRVIHDHLEEVLSHGNQQAIDIVTEAIAYAYKRVQPEDPIGKRRAK